MRKTLSIRRRDFTEGLIVALLFIVVMYIFDLPKQESYFTFSLFSDGMLFSFNAFRDKVLENERKAEMERAKMDYMDHAISSHVHEIKNPLTVFLGYMKLVASRPDHPTEGHHHA